MEELEVFRNIKQEDDQIFLSDGEMQQQRASPVKRQKEKEKQSFSEYINGKISILEQTQSKDKVTYAYNRFQVFLEQGQMSEAVYYYVALVNYEVSLQEIKKVLTEKILKETQKRSFKDRMKRQNFNLEFEDKRKLLFVKGKKDQSEFLKKRKKQTAILIAQEKLKNVYGVSKLVALTKFFENSLVVLRSLENASQLLQLALKVRFLNGLIPKKYFQDNQQSLTEFYELALWSALKEEDYPNAFYFVKRLVTLDDQDSFVITLLNLVFKKIKQPQLYRTWIAKLVPHQNHSLRQTIANTYFNNGFYEVAIKTYYALLHEKQTPLYDLLISLSYLQLCTSRFQKQNRENLLRKALFFFERYKDQRKDFHEEIVYNMGRFFYAMNIPKKAMDCFQELLDSQFKQKAAFNLMQIHKSLGNRKEAFEYLNQYLSL